MNKGKTTWKYNKLLTARKNYFEGGGPGQFGPREELTNWASSWGYTPNPIPETTPNSMGIVLGDYTKTPTVIKPGESTIQGIIKTGNEKYPYKQEETTPKSQFNLAGWTGLASGVASSVGGMITDLEAKDVVSNTNNMIASANSTMSRRVGSGDNYNQLLSDMSAYNPLGRITEESTGKKSGASIAGGALTSAASGAASGAALGPLGSVAGAIIGAGTSLIGSFGRNNKIKNATAKINKAREEANAFNERQFLNRADNIATNQLQNLEANYAALGGGLHTQGSDFTNGLLYIDNGGSHESNPYEGVPMGVDPEGVPNLVEEGETIFNNYVFSNRMAVPKAVRTKYKLREGGFLSFADASKKLAKESEERPNDPISLRGLEAMLAALAQSQEEVRGRQKDNNMAALGGNLFFLGSWMELYLNPDGSMNFPLLYAKDSPWMDRHNTMLKTLNGNLKDSLAFRTEYANLYNSINGFKKGNSKFLDPKDITADYFSKVTGDGTLGTHYGLVTSNAFDKYLGPVRTVQERHMLRGENGATELPIAQRYFKGRNDDGKSWGELNPTLKLVDNGLYTSKIDPKTNIETRTYFYDNIPEKKEEDKQLTSEDTINSNNTFNNLSHFRYAPAAASGLMALTDAFGLTNTPDYSEANAIMESTRAIGLYAPITYNPIGNYMTYKPFDRNYAINKLNAEAGATRRALLNTSNGNRATAMAGILNADSNYLNQLGELTRKAEEFNLSQRQHVAEFNKATNQANSAGFLQAAVANNEAAQKAKDSYFKGLLTASEFKQKERLLSTLSRSNNLSNFIESLGDIGWEEFNRNMIISDPSKYYVQDRGGNITYKKDFDSLSKSQQNQVKKHAAKATTSKKNA